MGNDVAAKLTGLIYEALTSPGKKLYALCKNLVAFGEIWMDLVGYANDAFDVVHR
jgi:hypothetical protein